MNRIGIDCQGVYAAFRIYFGAYEKGIEAGAGAGFLAGLPKPKPETKKKKASLQKTDNQA